MTIEELKDALLADPFSSDLRARYAQMLLGSGRLQDALVQFELLARHDLGARPWMGKARCLLAMGDPEEAVVCYQRARHLDGFEVIDELERLVKPLPARPPTLGLVTKDGTIEVRPSAEPSAIRFDDIGGLDDLKKSLRLQIIEPFLRPGLFARFKKSAGGGFLLYGPPGCGKTLVARALAGEIKGEFINVGVSDVVSMWFGDSEAKLASLFDKARSKRPSVLFFDELDALAFARSKAGSEHTRRIVNEFLAQLDGLMSDNDGILILAATNMPWDIDPAMKRSGRFSRQIFVPPPDASARRRILELKLSGVPVGDIDADAFEKVTEMFSGADLELLVDAAKEQVLAEVLDGAPERPIMQDDLVQAARSMRPTTLDWLRTARNLVRYGAADSSYRDVEKYLRAVQFT